MSKRYTVFLHRNVTDEYSPIFECIYATEVSILLLFLFVAPFPIWIALKAQPVHRNLRYAFALAAVQGIFGTTSRLALLFAHMINITLERLVATLFWSWYEKQGRSTILVLIITLAILEFFAVWSACPFQTAYYQHNGSSGRNWRLGTYLEFVVSKAIVHKGFAILYRYNIHELRRIRKDACFDKYSLNRTYQLRENVSMMRMLIRIAGPTVILNAPAFVFYTVHLLIPKNIGYDLIRYLAIAMYDYWITVYSVIMALAFPFFERRFRRLVNKAPIIGFIMPRNVRITPSDRFDDFSTKYVAEDHEQTTDHYFNWLKKDLNKASKYK
ncbi:hypothetical protein PRIPAC_79624 [Pristionchus pacificus]|uniref:G protein-coupled receptor n=1 Tax=Pristionchus pacificus TaxID=54126 RepID=A0A2A6C4C1_PRIPA|nr:hypothetical protein PRIPAC_79624 [Pristionchus pacificus]|eukprot:PDM73025.1 G protein-coupled receptor [Pristionchus pacificus]